MTFGVLLLSCVLFIAKVQCQNQDSNNDVCQMSTGWAYASASSSASASASGGVGGSSSGGGYAWASGICVQAKKPSDCIRANPYCSWCAQTEFSGQRCNIESVLVEQDCRDVQTISSSSSMGVSMSSSGRFSTDHGEASIRVGDSVGIQFTVSEPEIYPVDFYYLMDVSYSMREDLAEIQSLGSILVDKLQQLTKGGNGSVQLGFGKFVDKVQSPMTQMTTFKLKHPYVNWTDPPFLFTNVVDLTSDVPKFEKLLKDQTVSGNMDPPEGALDAMLQVVQCKKLIGWRPSALRLLMIATESAFHYAGDGSGFLAGISKSNDGLCHTGSDGRYIGAETQDYPTINQVVRAVEDNSITPIFAVRELYKDLYKAISKDYFRGSTWGVLKRDSSNVVDLVEQAYLDITGKQELITDNPDESILCPWYGVSIAGKGASEMSVHNTQVEGLQSGSKVNYTLFLAANRGGCQGSTECDLGYIEVKDRRYDDKIRVKTKVVGGFDCANNVQFQSDFCSSQGDFFCGICVCYPGWTGPLCNIADVGVVGCINLNAELQCSGRGTCINNRCRCNHGYRYNKERIFGNFCECDECPKRTGLVCSGNGIPTTVGDCSCNCICQDGWSGEDCSCPVGIANCLSPDGLVCSGRGKCECGTCICHENSRYGGPKCDICLVDCPTCGKFQDCIQCTMYGTGPKNETCSECESLNIYYVEPESITEEESESTGHTMCVALDTTDNCKFYYNYKEMPDGSMELTAEKEKRCKPSYSLIVVLWCILLVLLIGLILLCCWRCCIYCIDKEEEKNYRLSSLARFTAPALIPLLPAMTAGNVVEFIKAKYLMRKSAKVAVIPVRRSFFAGKTNIKWKTYAGSSGDDDFEVLSEGEGGTLARKRHIERVRVGDTVVEMEPLGASAGGNGAAASSRQYVQKHSHGTGHLTTVDETMPLLDIFDWGSGQVVFADSDEFASIEIPLIHDFSDREVMFWVELYGQEKGVALGLKRTKVIVIKDEDGGRIGFPKPSYVFKENDQTAVIPVHRTVGMDGQVSVGWFTRDITAISGKHYNGGRGILNFEDGEVTKRIDLELIPDIVYDDTEKAFNIELEDPKGGATLDLAHCMVTVLCDEECSLLQFPKEAYPFMENCGIAEVPVIRTRSTKGSSSVYWKTEDDTAFAGKDYEASQGILTFKNAVTEAHIQIPIIDNNVFDEAGRSFRIVLYDPSEQTKLANDIATISIIEDDEPGQFEFTKTSIVMRRSSSATFVGHMPVMRSLGTDGLVTVPWIIQNHDNQELPPEIADLSGSVEFNHGEITRSADLDLSRVPHAELIAFEIILLQPTGGGKLGPKHKALVNVFGEEDVGVVSFAQPRFDSMATAGMATLLVSRKGNVDNAAFVMFETSDKTAISGTHYRGGTSSIVFEANEAAKEIGIPIYNDPNYQGQLTFKVVLKSTPGGPKIGDIGSADVVITCVQMAPVIHAGAAPPGPCTVELIKSKYLVRRSAKAAFIPVHRSSTNGTCIVDWAMRPMKGGRKKGKRTGSTSSTSSSSSEEGGASSLRPSKQIRIPHDTDHAEINVNIEEFDIDEAQMSIEVFLLDVVWEDDIGEDICLGLKRAEVVILNDVDAGTLGFPKATFPFNSNEGVVSLPIHRLGGMDGDVSIQWCTKDDTALAGIHFDRDSGVIEFANNEIIKKIDINLLHSRQPDLNQERQFTVELGATTGGAKIGIRTATIRIISEEDRSVVQFSKPSYPVIGNSTSVKIPVFRTGDSRSKVIVQWYTEDGTAKQGLDYKLCRDFVTFEPDSTRTEIEIPLSGRTTEPKTFAIVLCDPLESQSAGNVVLGENKVATVAIISSRDPGAFEFSKPSFVFKTSAGSGHVPVVRSNGTDGQVTLPWRIVSRDERSESPFAGAEGFLNFEEGQISASVEVGLQGVPSNAFVLILMPPTGEGKLGATTQATVTIIGEAEEPVIEMDPPSLSLKTNEVVKVSVVRRGDLEETTCVGWKTVDGTASNGNHFIGGTGNLVLNPGEAFKEIVVPVLHPPTEEPATFFICLTDVKGPGKLGDTKATEVTLEPMPKTYVEFLRKRHHFRESQGTALVPIHRSDGRGILTLRWESINLTPSGAKKALSALERRLSVSSSSSSDEEQIIGRVSETDEDYIDWGSGAITFDDGERETAIELVLSRDMPTKESNFKIALIDPWDKVHFGIQETIITVLKDRDPGSLGFASSRYDFSCNDKELVLTVHRSTGADGTVSVPWFTRDGSAVGGTHYLPDDGNLVFRDGEVLRKITVPMPRKAAIFGEDEVAFELILGEPTGGAVLGTNVALIILRNDVVTSFIGFPDPDASCEQSDVTVSIPVVRTQGTVGKVVVPWRAVSAPGKSKSRYEGTNDVLVFKDNEDRKTIELQLPKGLQSSDKDFFVLELDQPKSGRAQLSDINQCFVTISNDISMGTFSLSSSSYSFNQSEGRGCVTVIRRDGMDGETSLQWKIKSTSSAATPSIMHNKRGVIEFNPGQTEAKIEIPLPKDSEHDEESFTLSLSPPGGRGKLGEPKQAEVLLKNDVECTVGFPQPLFETRGDADTFLLPIIRKGPKGRSVSVKYKTKDGTARDLTHFIGEDGTVHFDPGEDHKDILIPILNDPDGERVLFEVELHDLEGPGCLDVNDHATVAIDNLAGPGIFIMASSEMEVKQSSGVAVVTIIRTHGRKGAVELPWFAEQVSSGRAQRKPTSYDILEGKLIFNDGEGQKMLEIPLEKSPQDEEISKFDMILLTPTSGGGASLGDIISTRVTVNNDIDGGTLEMATDKVEVFGTDKEVIIPVLRSGSVDHKCYVTWEAEDISAVRGKHYKGGRGNLSFEPGEKSKKITIPIMNDPSGDVMFFNVTLGETKGGAKVGDKKKTQVVLDHVRENGEISFKEPLTHFKQSDTCFSVTLLRKTGSTGRVVVPWKVVDALEGSPYYGLRGQETFKDGEVESHIEIMAPESPQYKENEMFRIVLGEPNGGAFLTSDCECNVTVENDVLHGCIAFPDEVYDVNQSQNEVKIPITRSKRTKGRVRVPWKTITASPTSLFADITGVETFEDGDKTSHVVIKLPQIPHDTERDQFKIALDQPKSSDARLGDISSCVVNVHNDIEPALVTFEDPVKEVVQSKGRAYITVIRQQRTAGRVILPWKLVPEVAESPYIGVVGETVLEDGDDKGMVEVHLPQVALPSAEDKVILMLEEPIGAKLADDALCSLRIINDVGEGIFEMKSRNVTCCSEDGQATVTVARKLGHDFPGVVQWKTENGDAISGVHYEANLGKLKFRPGEFERPILIPLINDPTGETRHFKVKLTDVQGRDKIGEITDCKVRITNEATPPNAVKDFDAELDGPQSIKAKWNPPQEGAPLEGYKVSYWSRPGTTKTIEVSPEVTEVVLEPLDPSTSYQVLVRPYNDVGDGPTSNTAVVDTQPEIRLSYDTPQQFKTSEKMAVFTLTRNLTTFKTTVDYQVVKEIRKRVPKKYDTSSSESSSSSSSEDETQAVVPLQTAKLEFQPGQSVATVELPLDQKMKKVSEVYCMRVYPVDKPTEKPLANIEIQIINDTGVPGHVRKPFCAASTPRECTVSWEEPTGGGPVEGYKVVAKSNSLPDVVEKVDSPETKVVLTGLEPSTDYTIRVQPYNSVGVGKPSSPAHTKTPDELKVEFAEKFYTFRTSEKVAVIPIKRHFTRGYVTLKWNTHWSKKVEDEDPSSSSDEGRVSPENTWASGSVSFMDGQDTAQVQIPLNQASPPKQKKKRSFFWLYILDPNRRKRLAAMKCGLVDDKECCEIGFSQRTVEIQGGWEAENIIFVPVVRENDTAGDIIADWRIDPESPGSQYVMSDSLEGSVAFSDGEVGSSIILQIQNNWVDVLAVDPIDISVLLTSAGNGAHLAVDQARHSCVVRLIPAERGVLSVALPKIAVPWPDGNQILSVLITRDNGTYGSVYVQWKLIPISEKNIESDIYKEEEFSTISSYLPTIEGEVRFANGDDCVEMHIPIETIEKGERKVPPSEDLAFLIQLDCLTPGVLISETTRNEMLVIQQPPNLPGTFEFESSEMVVTEKRRPLTLSVPVVRSNGDDGDIFVDYACKDASALSGMHYVNASGSLHFLNSELAKPIDVKLLSADYKEEVSFFIDIVGVRNGGKSGAVATQEVALRPTYIEQPGKIVFSNSAVTAARQVSAKDTKLFSCPIQRTGGSDGEIAVTIITRDKSARAGVNYVALKETVFLSDGQTHSDLSIGLLPAKYRENLEFEVILKTTDEDRKEKETTLTVKLLPTQTVPVGRVAFVGGSKGQRLKCNANEIEAITIPIKRFGDTSGEISVHVTTKDGSAKRGEHFQVISEAVNFNDGESLKDIKVQLIPQNYRSKKTFQVLLHDPGDETGRKFERTLDITLLPTYVEPPGKLMFPSDLEGVISVSAIASEILTVPIVRSSGSGGKVTVLLKIKDGTAKSGKHFKKPREKVIFQDGETEKDILIPLVLRKYRKTLDFSISITKPSGGAEVEGPTDIKVLLQPTDTEPCGNLVFPEDASSLIFSSAKSKQCVIQVYRINGGGGELTGQYSTADGTALSGHHYKPVSGGFVLKPNEMERKIKVPLIHNIHYEDLYFSVLLESSETDAGQAQEPVVCKVTLEYTREKKPGRMELPDSQGTSVCANDLDILKVRMHRVEGSDGILSVACSTVDKTALNQIHYQESSAFVSFEEGETEKSFEVPLIKTNYRKPLLFGIDFTTSGNAEFNRRESLEVKLEPTDNTPSGELVIHDPIIFPGQSINIPMLRINGCAGEMTVECESEDLSAKSDTHYRHYSESFIIADGEMNGSVTIPLILAEYDEELEFAVKINYVDDLGNSKQDSIIVALPPASVRKTGCIGFIENQDLQFSPLENSVIKISILRTEGCDEDIFLQFRTKEGTAVPGTHYKETEGQVSFHGQEQQCEIEIMLIPSAKFTEPVNFEVNITCENLPEGFSLGSSTAIITLLPTEKEGTGILGFALSSIQCCAKRTDTVEVLVRRTGGAQGRVEIDFNTRDNTAVAGTHFTDTSGVITFEDGEVEKTISIPLSVEEIYTEAISFSVELGHCSAGSEAVDIYGTEVTLEPTASEQDLIDDPGVLGFTSPKFFYSSIPILGASAKDKISLNSSHDGENQVVRIPVCRTYGTSGIVTVDYFTRDNTAVAETHYREAQGELVFESGQVENHIEVSLESDAMFSEDISFIVELGGTTGDAEVGIYETEVELKTNVAAEDDSFQSLDGSYLTETSEDMRVRQERKCAFVYEAQTVKVVMQEEVIAGEVTEDHGQIGFAFDTYYFDPTSKNHAIVTVERLYSDTGLISVEWSTRENTAISGLDYIESSGTIYYQQGDTMQQISIPLVKNRRDETRDNVQTVERNFIVELGNCEGGATVGRYEATVSLLPSDKARLTSPKDPELEVSGPNTINVSWNTHEINAQEYWVSYKRAGSRDDPSRKTASPESGGIELTGLEPESTYAVVLTAVGEGGKQASTEVMSCSTPGNVPGAPNRLVFQVLSPTSLQCSWGEPANPNGVITSYEVMYQPVDKGVPPILVRIPDGHYRSLLVEELEENQPYKYNVRAKNKWGYGPVRQADMKIEHVGSRPPSAIFLDVNDVTYLMQQQQLLDEQKRQREERIPVTQQHEGGTKQLTTVVHRQQQEPTTEVTQKSATKTRVTRYIHKDGQSEPEVETQEFDGRLSQDELAKLAAQGGRIETRSPSLEVQVISYNTTQRSTSSGTQEPYHHQQQGGAAGFPPMDPEEYTVSDTTSDMSQNVEEFTDVQKTKEGDADVTTITKTYKTTTTERRLDTERGMRKTPVRSTQEYYEK